MTPDMLLSGASSYATVEIALALDAKSPAGAGL
jgi:hypothetical protein